MAKRWIGTSWKMNKTLAEARSYTRTVRDSLAARPQLRQQVQPFLIPPATALAAVHEELSAAGAGPVGIKLGAQNAHWHDHGAWTGEISVPQAVDAGAEIIEIGHSERREHFNETIPVTRLKVLAALRHGAQPLLCIGEPEAVRRKGRSSPYILQQADGALDGLNEEQLGRVLIAYEPIWAIGDAGRPAATDELMEPFSVLHNRYGGKIHALLYGGSVNKDNARTLLNMDHVDGLFIGRAAWQAEDYIQLLELAVATTDT